ncbi:SRPBCC domain-containing protein [Phycicoccus sp. MAQZ13P-2]|uniref:SRPBCC family protein n=1 Tax=Phycicoccus mangrovi TaxID=2840470 RepID=UPI001C006BEF|nr:SRPBCC domain-containing protein [Phycicoccus mangrovi]MBT9273711.1 SRPBCC domain-containing protein [Phycicoccus mangrovi]
MSKPRGLLSLTRILDAPRALVYRAFTNAEDFASWWGPTGNVLPADGLDFDVRAGGHQRWTEVNPSNPDLRVRVTVDLHEVRQGELLDGVMRVNGRLDDGLQPFETRLRVEFHDTPDGRTRLEIRQWIDQTLDAAARQGWSEGLAKLDRTLARLTDGA